jgi:hypothetical protein
MTKKTGISEACQDIPDHINAVLNSAPPILALIEAGVTSGSTVFATV